MPMTRLFASLTLFVALGGLLFVHAQPPSIDKGEVTDKGTITQKAVLNRRQELVKKLYEP